ncbi:MAG: Uma2 family endonuclease [Bryobacterales bacterium]|nr:Uma2 family endonuclease [Bryobacterales bacterium]
MGTTAVTTLEQFLTLPDDGCRHELDEGALVVSPPSSANHGDLSAQIVYLLRIALKHHKEFRVMSESGFVLDEDPYTVRAPDVSVCRRDRTRKRKDSPYLSGAPEIAVDVLSPSDTASRIRKKLRQYLNAGAVYVWLVDGENREVEVHEAGQRPLVLTEKDTLTVPKLLPELAIAVAEIFADVET